MVEEGQQVSLKDLINPHPRQVEFLQAMKDHMFTLYGGARGGGKSRILRWAIVAHLLRLSGQGLTHLRAGIFCETFPELRMRQWEPAGNEFPDYLGRFNQSEFQFKFHEKWGGHTISFLNLDKPEKYKSAEFCLVAIDELTLCPNRQILDVFLGCLRSPGVQRCPFIAATNPDGPGHSWVKRLWVNKDFTHPDDMTLKPEEFYFVRALPTDNPHLSKDYIETNLAGLPESLRKPWLEGSWDLFEGQRFEFNPRVHCIDQIPLSQLEPAKYYRSIDYGFDNPYCCLWFAVYRDEFDRQCVRLVHEDVKSGLKVQEQIQRVINVTRDLGLENRISGNYLDTACWKEEDDGLSIADKWIAGGVPVMQVLKDRPAGWTALENMLYFVREPGVSNLVVIQEPRLKIFRNCVHTMQQITDAMWEPKKPGDIMHPEGFRDDALDALRYFVMTHFAAPVKKKADDGFDHQRKVWKAMSRSRR